MLHVRSQTTTANVNIRICLKTQSSSVAVWKRLKNQACVLIGARTHMGGGKLEEEWEEGEEEGTEDNEWEEEEW